MKILAVAGDPNATIADIRIVRPLQLLCAKEGWALRLRPLHRCDGADLAWADALVLQRGVSARALRLIERMRAVGGRTVYEIDDLLLDLPAHVSSHADGQRQAPWVRRCLSAADAVSASTARLARAVGGIARRVEVVPNYAMPAGLHGAPFDAAAPTTLLMASSDRLAAECVVPAVTQALAERPGRLRVVCIGMAGAAFPAQLAGVERHPALPRDDFAALVASLPNVIGLIPLGSTPFDACKSAIKFFDYAALGVAALCSNVPPYADVVEHDRTGLLVANTAPAWAAGLSRLIDEPALRGRLTAEARTVVGARHHVGITVEAWRRLLLSLGERAAPAAPPGRLQTAISRCIVALRAANRSRLARRRARPTRP